MGMTDIDISMPIEGSSQKFYPRSLRVRWHTRASAFRPKPSDPDFYLFGLHYQASVPQKWPSHRLEVCNRNKGQDKQLGVTDSKGYYGRGHFHTQSLHHWSKYTGLLRHHKQLFPIRTGNRHRTVIPGTRAHPTRFRRPLQKAPWIGQYGP